MRRVPRPGAGPPVNEQRWALSVERTQCQGSGVCVSIAPGHFELRGGRAQPVRPLVEADEAVLEAAETCPMEAVFVRESTSGRQLAPPE
ncbi:ferredoxin [Streptomyces sp. NPDC056883]|uniref:ferredoxin n=1 Tax=Streptomyces sp. NPDC056883 TaxID=3345959 RepID=UPI00368D2543